MDDCLHKGIKSMILKASRRPMSSKQRQRLVRKEKSMRAFVSAKYSKNKRNKFSKQAGGFWGALIGLPIAAKVLGDKLRGN